jgi:7-carboxy-7-deazaguanine synthase
VTTGIQAPDLVISEVFRAWQGEGPSAGRRCAFVRLGGCNLTCGWRRTTEGLTRVDGAWACDEAKTWHPGYGLREHLTRTPVPDILTRALAYDPPLVVVTGGEPLLHQDQPGFAALLAGLLEAGAAIEIETNGTLIPAWTSARVAYNVSPKLASSGLEWADRFNRPALDWHVTCPRSAFKFVAATPADVTEAARLADLIGLDPARTWIMPEGITTGRVLSVARAIAATVMDHGFNLTLRQHVLIYDDAGEPRDD